MKWSWSTLLCKLTSRKFWVWAVTSIITYKVLRFEGDEAWRTPVIIVWGIVSVIYLCGEVIIDALGKAIEKAKIELTLGIGGKK